MRRSRDVIQELLDEMKLISSYHPKVGRTEKTVDKLIDGTAFFPGGTGLWRGENPHGPLPEYFPHAPIMFVAHNFGNKTGYEKARNNGGEAQYYFWQNLREYLRHAGVPPKDCFFTNALMGIKPGKATGAMPPENGYKDQCQRFLRFQIKIVRPSHIFALGEVAKTQLSAIGCATPWALIMHPTDWKLRPGITREARQKEQGETILEKIRKK